MPELPPPITLTARRQEAFLALEAYLKTFPDTRRLSQKEVNAYARLAITDGWRLKIAFSDVARTLNLLVDCDFPYSVPRIGLADRLQALEWPHVESDNVMCLLPQDAAISCLDSVSVAKLVLGDACRLIEDCLQGRNTGDFKDEFLSYWHLACGINAPRFVSLVEPNEIGRSVIVWRANSMRVVADESKILFRWLERAGMRKPKNGYATHEGILLWLPEPMLPREYPRTAADVYTLARSHCDEGLRMLEALVFGGQEDIDVVIGAATTRGVCFAGAILSHPQQLAAPGRPMSNVLTRGFRPGRVPKKILLARRFNMGAKIMRATVDRADHRWIHGRDQDPQQGTLRRARIAVLGCGSVGGPVARLLAQAGVGNHCLVDPQTLEWSNIIRHELGGAAVGKAKASALAEQLGADFPHLGKVSAHVEAWGLGQKNLAKELQACDLIVSAMGNWGAESLLNAYQKTASAFPPIVYAWLEPHAICGHAVVVFREGPCVQCGFTATGSPQLRVTDWPSETDVYQAPACGATFTPYGSIESAPTQALIAELAVDVLLKRVTKAQHRVWIGRRRRLEETGGGWNKHWRKQVGDPENGGFLLDRSWLPSATCIVCAGAQAA